MGVYQQTNVIKKIQGRTKKFMKQTGNLKLQKHTHQVQIFGKHLLSIQSSIYKLQYTHTHIKYRFLPNIFINIHTHQVQLLANIFNQYNHPSRNCITDTRVICDGWKLSETFSIKNCQKNTFQSRIDLTLPNQKNQNPTKT